ncbi:MAG: repressor LexA [Candidatus Ryanbacteria bacterium RIFCSPHIGHO2_02_FULL_48_12]|uniref:Repressor LexA n=1 Tax=Candidatus Ryanbacteria bacterium RIFCSPHIGHO2_01_FULL_48_27 TaxID=1802115 RepID=A0A1G2G7D2_9BACT|nr:MAG: repressor LexA [Candidatus Ryanbacteria bacterium RIFCSPHIGHO2_01_FULL_48_27]OGZ49517.1 MAG: repressor LexA [Candidatus Ryanbacteria bacterium RIFCSPHIGHO2_02_FULL_48_12]
MKESITTRQKQLLSIIYQYIRNSGYPPAFEEMKDGLGVVSNQSVIDLLEKLSRSGAIKRNEGGARSIVILPFGYGVLGAPPLAPFVGVAAAGVPMEAIEISGSWHEIPSTGSDKLARLAGNVFILKISGDSMINAGIDDGDLVLIQEKKEFISKDIVYAQIGEDATIKRFVSEDKPPYVYLKPENPRYGIINFTDETELKGKVVSVFKEGYWKPVV